MSALTERGTARLVARAEGTGREVGYLNPGGHAPEPRSVSAPCRATLYGILTGLMLSAAAGWLWVAAFALLAGPWLGWRIARRA